MAKRRRTRAQKQRAAARRTEDRQVLTPAKAIKDVIAEPEPSDKSSSPEETKNKRRSDLGRSLILLGSLLGAQVGLWLIFRSSQLDERLYEWIKL